MSILVRLCMISCFTTCFMPGAALGQSLGNLYTTANGRIRAAPFHVLYLSSFSSKQASNTLVHFNDLIRIFDNDLEDIGDANNQSALISGIRVAQLTARTVKDKAELDAAVKELKEIIRADLARGSNAPVVLIYLLCHGKPDGADVQLSIGTEKVSRTTVRDMAKAISDDNLARFVVLITDNCHQDIVPSASGPAPGRDAAGGVWRALYFGHKKFVHVQTSEANEFAYLDVNGSLFVQGLKNSLAVSSLPEFSHLTDYKRSEQDQRQKARTAFVRKFDVNGDKVVSWTEFQEHLKSNVAERLTQARTAAPADDKGPAGTQTVLLDTTETEVLPPRP